MDHEPPPREPGLPRDVRIPIQKYNISLRTLPGRWDSYGIPQGTNQSRKFPFINSGTFLANALSGAPMGRETAIIHEFPIYLGESLPPSTVRALSYMGEYLTDQQFRKHVLRHEVGHAAISRDFAVVLQQAVPGQEMPFLQTGSLAAADARNSRMPLSMLHKLGAYKTHDERFLEDLAEMYAIKARSMDEGASVWNKYQQLVLEQNPNLEPVFWIIDKLFAESQRLDFN